MIERIKPFANHLPVRIRFGEGAISALADVLAAEGASRPFVVVDEHVQPLPPVERALAAVEARC